MSVTRPGPNVVSRFDELRLPSIPAKLADGVRSFLEEDISAQNLFDLRAIRRTSGLPEGAKLYKGSDPLNAFTKAFKSHHLKTMLRVMFINNGPLELDLLLLEGSEAVFIVSGLTGRFSDVQSIVARANLLMSNAIETKLRSDDEEIGNLKVQLCASAALLAGLKAIQDIDFTRKEELMAHAQERWNIIEKGFGIYLYDRNVPYLYCVGEGGTSSLPRDNDTFHGPACTP